MEHFGHPWRSSQEVAHLAVHQHLRYSLYWNLAASLRRFESFALLLHQPLVLELMRLRPQSLEFELAVWVVLRQKIEAAEAAKELLMPLSE